MFKGILSTVFLLNVFFLTAQVVDPLETKDSMAQQKWVDTLINTMSVEEKIGQLFMVAAYSNLDEKHKESIEELIEKQHIGGLIFMQGTPLKQAQLTNNYQSLSKIPLIVAIDGEWGLDMRLKNAYRFPWNMTLGAIRDNKLIEKFGAQLGAHCKRLGIHINFAPVVDININPENPIIGNRSFGESRENVAEKSISFTKGIQSQHVLANAKHFPGHGDTATDSHKALPIIDFSLERLDSIELYPYKGLFKNKLASVMVAHLSVKALEPSSDLPTSISRNVITGLLKDKMSFNGLILTDALNMKGVSNYVKPIAILPDAVNSKNAANQIQPGDIDLAAIMAGNDMLLMSENVPEAILKIKNALQTNIITEERLNYSVKKILKAKYWAGLNQLEEVKIEGLNEELNNLDNDLLHRELVENSITLLKNKAEIFPVKDLQSAKIAYVKFGDSDHNNFVEMLQNYAEVDVVSSSSLDGLMTKLKPYNLVVVGYHKSNENPWKSYKFRDTELVWLQEIARNKKVILDIFSSPYSMLKMKSFENIEGLLLSYQNSKISQEISAQMIFGALGAKGKIPVSIHSIFPEGSGLISQPLKRLAYALPESVGLSSEKLKGVDSLAEIIVSNKMAPGMQILVARKGKVVYNRSFGYHTSQKKKPVKNTDLYDVASLTKILSTLPLLMELEEKGTLKLESTLGSLLPKLKSTNKENLTVKQVLSHYGRLKAWIPFYLKTLDSVTKMPSSEYYRDKKSDMFAIQVAENLYLRNDYKDSIFEIIVNADQRPRRGYKYSDLSYYLFKDYIENHYQRNLNELSQQHFYKAIGAARMTYLPKQKFSLENIVPTEKDDYYRNQLVHGHVHDMGAAMQGGIGGHAGLFANANDVAKMMQMYLQDGYYGGKQYFKPETIKKFNHRYYSHYLVRKGVGFDKPQLRKIEKATCDCVSDESFGQSGFTGTYTWADPKTELVYVFLSNRIYPTAENTELVRENFRTKIQQVIQDAIIH